VVLVVQEQAKFSLEDNNLFLVEDRDYLVEVKYYQVADM
jgi:hypothetical protein